MISLNVHGITDVKVEEIHNVFKDSYCKVIRISTREEVLVEILLFAEKPKTLEVLE